MCGRLLAISQKETDEMGFVPCTPSEPRGAFYWCDNRCSEQASRYMQIASMVIEEGGEARTINLCKLYYNAKPVQQCKQPLKSWEWKEVEEKKGHRGRMWKVFENEQLQRNVGVFHSQEGRCKEDSSGCCSRKQEGKPGQWQQDFPFKEVLEQVKRSADTDRGP